MQIHQIVRDNPNKKAKIVGRGGRRGKQSGRGGTGQTARAGNKRRPAMRDIIKKIPKLRGRGIHALKPINAGFAPVNLTDLNIFNDGDTVTRAAIVAKGLLSTRFARYPKVKILGTGEIEKKLVIEGCMASETAKAKIEKAGGSFK